MNIGDTLLIGVNYFSSDDQWQRSEQVFGEIISIEEHTIWISCQDSNEEKAFPLIEEAIEEGDGGAYQFHDNATPVINPKWVATFRATLPE